MNTRLPAWIACAVILLTVAGACAGGWRYVRATDPQPHTDTLADCTKCHSDPATIQMMEWKGGTSNSMFTPAFLKAHPFVLPKAKSKGAVCPAHATPEYQAASRSGKDRPSAWSSSSH